MGKGSKDQNTNNFSTTNSRPSVTRRTKFQLTLSRVRRKLLRHLWLMRIFILSGICLFLFVGFLGLKLILRNTTVGEYASLFSDFVFTPSSRVKSIDGVTNVLIMGKGGAGHEAPDLTDTMIFVSIPEKDADVTLISLPRDIWIPELRAKINSAYYWGNQKASGGGLILAKSVVEEVVGKPIQYAVVIDFSEFKKIIDILGGVNVNVEHSLVDNKYPIAGKEDDPCGGDPELKCRYETVEFREGLQRMDGETALKFARSRNAEGDEGTDFARAARQQKVIEALKDRILFLRLKRQLPRLLKLIWMARQLLF